MPSRIAAARCVHDIRSYLLPHRDHLGEPQIRVERECTAEAMGLAIVIGAGLPHPPAQNGAERRGRSGSRCVSDVLILVLRN